MASKKGAMSIFRCSIKCFSVSLRDFALLIPKTPGFFGTGYGGRWLWAAAGARSDGKEDQPFTIIRDMDGSMHECLLYLPLFSELLSLEIGVRQDCALEAIPNPFRHRIAIFGSSFTHGSSSSRSGMTYPAQLSRMTGLQLLSLGYST